MTYLDSWQGLASPARGLAQGPRQLPPVRLAREIPRTERERAVAGGGLVVVRRGVLGAPPSPGWAPSRRTVHEILQQAHAYAATARHDRPFSHQTAALLLGCWVSRPRLPVHVTVPAPATSGGHRTPHVRHHVGSLDASQVRLHDDVLVTSIERTVVDCARTLPLIEALTIADSALRVGADRTSITDQVAELGNGRGVRSARRVLELATSDTHSPGETIVRAVAIQGGLPRPETLHAVETEIGTLELDVAWSELRVAVEFDGAVKLAGLSGEALTKQVNANLARESALARAGWVVLHLTWEDLADRQRLLARLTRLVRFRAL